MVAAVAHEIRNPLGGIELYTGLLNDELADTPAAAHLKRIQSEIRYLTDIVHRFLDFARPEAPQKEPCMLSHIIRDVLAAMAPEFRENRLETSCEFPDKERKAMVDPAHVRRIFMNLFQNSLHASSQGGSIQISMHQDSRIRIRVQDSGSGIPQEALSRIFSPFFTTRDKGTGLGLAIVKKLTEANDGQIRLVQTGPEGTVFEIEFPG